MAIQINSTQTEVQTTSTSLFQTWQVPVLPIVVSYYQGGALPAAVTVPIKIRSVIGTGVEQLYNNFYFRSFLSLPPMPDVIALAGPVITNNVWVSYTNYLAGDVTVTFQDLNLLAPGTYTRQVTFGIQGANIQSGANTLVDSRSFTIIINVYTADTPVITPPSGFNFTWILGYEYPYLVSPAPVNINAASWSVVAPLGFVWVPTPGATVDNNPAQPTISGNGSLDINMAMFPGAVPEQITENPVTYYAQVNGGLIQIPVTVTLMQENGVFFQSEYLYFEALRGINDADAQSVIITFPGVPEGYTFVKPSWLTLVVTQQGNSITVVVQPISGANMDGGTYTGTIILYDSEGNETGRINVDYFINDAITVPYQEGGFAFTLDRQFIEFSAPGTSYFQIALRARVYQYISGIATDNVANFKVPLFNGYQKLNISDPVHRLMHTIDDLQNGNQLMYKPAEVYLDITQYAGENTYEYSMGPYLFVAGMPPALLNGCAFLDIADGARRVTATSYHIVNMLITGAANVLIYRNGTQVQGFSMQAGIRQYRMNFAQLGAVQGDVFEIRITFPFQTRYLKRVFKVFPEGYSSCHIIWENEHRLRSALECTGKMKVKNAFTNRSQELEQDLLTVLQKLESEKTATVTLNTGYILKSEKPFIESLVRSPRAILLINNRTYNIVPVSKDLITTDSDEALVAFDLDFQINANTNEEVYSF